MTDELIFDAVAMRLSAAIEEVSPIEEPALVSAFGDTWWDMKATRNAIAHNYAYVDEELLIKSIAEDLEGFEAGLNALRLGAAD